MFDSINVQIKTCQYCGSKYISVVKDQKYCCGYCKHAAQKKRMKKQLIDGQLCWQCVNACGKCPWSSSFTPVQGWIAKKVKRKDLPCTTYKIKYCPMFIKENY